jgi:hypothetical protein
VVKRWIGGEPGWRRSHPAAVTRGPGVPDQMYPVSARQGGTVAIVFEGSPPIPVRYESWGAWWRADLTQPLPPLPIAAHRAVSCPDCWGQGRIWEEARNGEGLVPLDCPGCRGRGLVLQRRAA